MIQTDLNRNGDQRKIGEFIESEESWTQYVEQLEQYFLANEVEDAKKQ